MIYNSQAEGCVIALVRRLCHWIPHWLLLCTGKKLIVFTLSTIIDYLVVFDDLELFRRLHCWVESTFLIDDLNFRTFLSGRWHWLPARQDALWQKWKNIARMRNCPGIVGSSDLETLNQSFWDQIYFALSDNISSVKCHSEPLWSSDKYHQIWPFCRPALRLRGCKMWRDYFTCWHLQKYQTWGAIVIWTVLHSEKGPKLFLSREKKMPV